MNKIIHKEAWGFWIFKRYLMILEDRDEGLTEIPVDKEAFDKYNVGDTYEKIS